MTSSIRMRKNKKSIVECSPQTNKRQESLEEEPKKKKLCVGISVDDSSSSPASKLITKSAAHVLANKLTEVKSVFEGKLSKERKKERKKIRLECDTDIKREPELFLEEELIAEERRISEKKSKKDRKMDKRKLRKEHPAAMREPERECSVEQELTAEERRVAERKLKKDRKKEERKSKKEFPTENKDAKSDLSLEEKLTAEERRVFERKLKKEHKKEMRRLKQACATDIKEAAPQKPSGCELALQYLTSWSQKAEDWKFQKTRQTWLLMHLYDSQKVSESHFLILLDYLEGLRGSARDLTVHKAEALMKEHENANSEDETVLQLMERARQVIQMLS